MFRDAYRVSIKVTQGIGTRYEAWMLADSRAPLIDGMSITLRFYILNTGVDPDTLLKSYEGLLSRMPASIRDMRGHAYVSQMNARRKAWDIHTLFLPLLLEVFLRRQKKSLKKAGYKETVLHEYFADGHKYLKFLLHKDSRAQMLAGRLEASKPACLDLLVLNDDRLSSVRTPKRRFLLKRDNLIHATQKAWQEWVRAVINDPTIITSDDTGNKNPNKPKNKAGRKERKSDRKGSKSKGDKEVRKPSNPPDGVKTTRHVAANNTQDGPVYEVIDPAAEIWGDPNDDAELGHRLDEIDTMVNTHDKDLYARLIDNQDGSLWMP